MPKSGRPVIVLVGAMLVMIAGSVGCGNQPAEKSTAPALEAATTSAPAPTSPSAAPADPLAFDPSKAEPKGSKPDYAESYAEGEGKEGRRSLR
jgi:hypothetical protein